MLSAQIRYNRRRFDVPFNPNQTWEEVSETIHNLTGVPAMRQKLVDKGALVKNMHALIKAAERTFPLTLIGTSVPLENERKPKVLFTEDVAEPSQAGMDARRVGLVNLEHTCYLNATLQVLRAIPELQNALNTPREERDTPEAKLTAGLQGLYQSMSQSRDAVAPIEFLAALRFLAPQFAERAPAEEGGEYLQQDASEAWTVITGALESTLPVFTQPGMRMAGAKDAQHNFINQYMSGRMRVTRACPQAPEDPTTSTEEPFTLLSCPIMRHTNDLRQGLLSDFTHEIEKFSPTIGRSVVHEEQRRISRLPGYLAIHFVRFFWRRDVGQKTKILRKVQFPDELDVWSLLTDELRRRTRPAANQLHDIRWARHQRQRENDRAQQLQRRRNLALHMQWEETDGPIPDAIPRENLVNSLPQGTPLTHAQEWALRREEEDKYRSSLDSDLAADVGCNPTGLYELLGVVTHKGPSADHGHYMGWVKQAEAISRSPAAQAIPRDREQTWLRFADENVDTFSQRVLTDMEGGLAGDPIAYLLLYRTKTLD